MQEDLTPRELIEKYPAITKSLNWSANTIGTLLSAGLLKGTYNRLKRVSFVQEDSFIKLIKYRNEILKTNILDV